MSSELNARVLPLDDPNHLPGKPALLGIIDLCLSQSDTDANKIHRSLFERGWNLEGAPFIAPDTVLPGSSVLVALKGAAHLQKRIDILKEEPSLWSESSSLFISTYLAHSPAHKNGVIRGVGIWRSPDAVIVKSAPASLLKLIHRAIVDR